MFAEVDRFNKICPCTCPGHCRGHNPNLAAMVKRERSPSPEIPPELVTEGAVRYAPIPEKCRKGHPGFQMSRRVWAEEAKKRLREQNVEPVRVFIRSVIFAIIGAA